VVAMSTWGAISSVRPLPLPTTYNRLLLDVSLKINNFLSQLCNRTKHTLGHKPVYDDV